MSSRVAKKYETTLCTNPIRILWVSPHREWKDPEYRGKMVDSTGEEMLFMTDEMIEWREYYVIESSEYRCESGKSAIQIDRAWKINEIDRSTVQRSH